MANKAKNGALHRMTPRNYRVILNPDTLRLLVDKLEIKDVKTFLRRIGINQAAPHELSFETVDQLLSRPHDVNMKFLIHFLRQGLYINYCHTLHDDGITLEGEPDHPRFQFEREISNFEGRMIVGADGKFSAGEQITKFNKSEIEPLSRLSY